MPAGTFVQRAELIVLIRVLTLGKEKRLKICSNSKYAFLVLNAQAAIWKDRGLFFRLESPRKHGKEILTII
jgi:hypothetical protein